MANNYCDMTGVLVLDKVTPVIKALFGVFELDERYPGNGEAYIACIAESSCCSWDSVLENLHELAQDLLGHAPENGETVDDVLLILATHFKAEQNEELANLIEHRNFEDEADLASLFTIARAFDDGHGLKAYKTETAWRCSQPRLFEFGGSGSFAGTHVAVEGSSQQIVQFGEALETALAASNTDAAAGAILEWVGSLLAGIHAESARAEVQRKLINLLSATSVQIRPDDSAVEPQVRPGDDILRINVRKALGRVTHEEDSDVAGIYGVSFNADNHAFPTAKRASMALDIFHAHQAIDCLDDFHIEVINRDGEVVEQDPEHLAYSSSDSGVVEKISDVPMPMDIGLYVADQGVRCPSCGSSDLDGSQLDVDGGTASQEMGCSSCDAEWVDMYKLTGYAYLEQGVSNSAE